MVLDEHGLSDDSLRGSEHTHFRVAPGGAADVDYLEPTSVQERAAADRLNRTALGFLSTYEPGMRQPTSPGSGQASAEPAPGFESANVPQTARQGQGFVGVGRADLGAITPADQPAIMPDVQYQTEVRLGKLEEFAQGMSRPTAKDSGPRIDPGRYDAPDSDDGVSPADVERGAPPSRYNPPAPPPVAPPTNPADRGMPTNDE